MKTLPGNGKVSGLTLIELLVIIAVIAILAAMLLPNLAGSGKANRPVCQSNQKQIAIALILFQGDHNEKYPWQVSVTNGGTMDLDSSSQAFPHFRALSAYVTKQTKIFFCPADKTRQPAENSTNVLNNNISYFLNLDATTNRPSDSICSGDRNLQANGRVTGSEILFVTTNLDMNWSRDLHVRGGNLAFADGHVEWNKTNSLNSIIARQPVSTNWLCIP